MELNDSNKRALALGAVAAAGLYARSKYIDGCKVNIVNPGKDESAVVGKTENGTQLAVHDVLYKDCPSLTDQSEAYMVPTPYLFTGLLQMFFAAANVKRRDSGSDIEYERELLTMQDGGTISLDWYPGKNPLAGDEKRPVVIMLCGAGGSSQEYFIRTLAKSLAHSTLKFRVAVFNHRGTSMTPLTSPRPYDMGFTGDIREAVNTLRKRTDSDAKLFGIGFSMGANIMTKYVGEEGDSCPLSAAVAVCCPFDVKIAGAAMNEKNFLNNNVFQPQVLSALKRSIKRISHLPPDPSWGLDMDKIMRSRQICEIEEAYLCKINGYKDLEEYYVTSSSSNYVDSIRIPYLAINSLDDRIAPAAGIPVNKFKQNPYLSLALVPHGGHLAFLTGTFSPKFWFIKPIQEFTTAMAKL